MQKIKKIFAVLLSVLMIQGIMMTTVLTTSAKDFNDVNDDDKYKEAIDMLSDIGIIVGTTESEFSPESNISREQMALLLYRLMNNKNNAGKQNTSPFIDLYDDNYNGAISWAYASKFILGVSDNQFDPRGGITLQDALAMITRALGHTNDKTNAGYPWSYITIASRLGLTKGLEDIGYTEVLTRAETAGLLYNALCADYAVVKNVSGVNTVVTTTALEYVFGYKLGEASIVATDSISLPSSSVITKDGYIRLEILDKDGDITSATADEAALKLDGNIDSYIGESFRIFYKLDSKNAIAKIVGASKISNGKTVLSFTPDKDNKFVTIDGVKYNVVESYSNNPLSNVNELIVYAYNGTSALEQVKTNEALSEKNGFFHLNMISDNGGVANRAILMPLSFGLFEVTNGSINLSGGLKVSELDGGFINLTDAENGDLVLYNYSSSLRRLVIAEKLDLVKNAQISRLNAKEATAGGKVYKLGVVGTEFTAEKVEQLLTLGKSYDLVVFDGRIIDAKESEESHAQDSKYVIATSETTPVIHGGKVCYFITANIDGKNESIYVTNASVTKNALYRATEKDGVYTLIDVSDADFLQKGELKTVIESASGATIAKNGNVYYTLADGETSVKFITDKNTVIIVGNGTSFEMRKGAYASQITVKDGANVVAVMNNEEGSVERLNILYISNGSLEGAVDNNTYVQIIEKDAKEYIGGEIFTAYKVLNCISGKIEVVYSKLDNLEAGKAYALDEDGRITSNEKILSDGEVTGYAEGIISIDDKTFSISADVKIVSVETLNGEHHVVNHSVRDIFGKNVSYAANGNNISLIIVNK